MVWTEGPNLGYLKELPWTEVALFNFWYTVKQMTTNPALILWVFLDSRVRTLMQSMAGVHLLLQ